MPTLVINGQKVNVGDDFLQLSPDQQNATVEQISGQLGSQPQQAPQQAPQQPVSGSFIDPLAQGVSFGFSDEIEGLGRAGVGSVMDLFNGGQGQSFGDRYTGARDEARARLSQYQQENPNKALAAELAGGLLTGGAGAARVGALKGAQSLGRLAATGAAQGGLYGAGVSENENVGGLLADTAEGAALGGITGAAIPALGRAAAGTIGRGTAGVNNFFGGGNNAVRQSAVDLLENSDVPLTAGQRGGSASIRARETDLATVPFIGGPLADAFGDQQTKIQKKLLGMSGFAKDDVTKGLVSPESIERAQSRFSERYIDALADTKINVSDAFADSLVRVQDNFTDNLAGGPNAKVNRIVNDLFDKASVGNLTGKSYQKLRSQLGVLERRNKSNDVLGSLYRDLKGALDEEFLSAASEKAGKAKSQLDKEYGQFSQIKELVKRNAGGAGGTVSGNLPITQLARIAQQRPGSEEWRKFLNASAAVIPDSIPNSGTGGRNLSTLLTGGGLGAGLTGGILPLLTAGAVGRSTASALANPLGVQRGAQALGRGVDSLGALSTPALYAHDQRSGQTPLRGLL